jgi:hypothetical protein
MATFHRGVPPLFRLCSATLRTRPAFPRRSGLTWVLPERAGALGGRSGKGRSSGARLRSAVLTRFDNGSRFQGCVRGLEQARLFRGGSFVAGYVEEPPLPSVVWFPFNQ